MFVKCGVFFMNLPHFILSIQNNFVPLHQEKNKEYENN